MRFHVLSLPHTNTTKDYTLCAYTEKVRKYCSMMKSLGHTVYLYAGEDNDADCDELITVASKADQHKWFGDHDYRSKFFNLTWGLEDEHWKVTNGRAIVEIGKRKQPQDFICVIAGLCQKEVADAHPDLMTVEFGIGYSGTFSPYRVFESYAWMHAVYGAESNLNQVMSVQGRFYDEVIPNYFEVEDFPYSDEKDDYYLYIGRLTPLKGYQIAIDTCKRLDTRLVLAGQGEPPDYGEYVGSVGPEERGQLMSRAQAVFVPSLYLEPFGGVHAEAMMCFPGNVQVRAEAINKAYKRNYSGALISIRTTDSVVECTPSHPFFTDRGWVAAKDLTLNDQLFQSTNTRRLQSRRIGDLVEGLFATWSSNAGHTDGPIRDVDKHQSSQIGPEEKAERSPSVSSNVDLGSPIGLHSGASRRRGDYYIKENGWYRKKITSPYSDDRYLQYVQSYDGVVTKYNNRPKCPAQGAANRERVRQRFDQPELGFHYSRTNSFAVLPVSRAIPNRQEGSNKSTSGILRTETGFFRRSASIGTRNRLNADDTVYEFTPIASITSREVQNLPVFNLGTSSGTYEANGLLVHNCGTPVITTDWGAFPENVLDGVTGFRCRTIAEFTEAARNVKDLDYAGIREYAVGRFSTDVVKYQYEKYFERLLTLWGEGFYT